jgi:hypothetical protein
MKSLFRAFIFLLGAAYLLAQQPGEQRRRISSPIAFYDDADISTPGMINVSQYFSYTKVPAGRDASFPSAYFSLGVNRRVGVMGTLSYARSQFEESRINGRGDSYFGAKFLIVPEGGRRPALAVEPMVEVLGDASIGDSPLSPDRVNYVFPLVLQKSFESYRVFYMAGYLTRGIIFNSFALELDRWSRITPIAIISGSRLTREQGLISEFGLNRSRQDVVGGVAFTIRPGLALFVNSGRSFGRIDVNSSRYQVTFGFSFNARLWGEK